MYFPKKRKSKAVERDAENKVLMVSSSDTILSQVEKSGVVYRHLSGRNMTNCIIT